MRISLPPIIFHCLCVPVYLSTHPLKTSWLLPGFQFSSVAQLCPTLCDPMNPSMPGLPVYHQLPGFTQTRAYGVGDAIQPSHPLLSPFPPAPNPSQHQSLFQWVNSSHEVAKSTGVSALASFLPKNTPGLISFRMDWMDLLAVQGTLKSLLQHHSSKASILWRRSALDPPYSPHLDGMY